VTRTVTRKRLVSLGAAALLTASLAGCGTSTAGAAAVVGDRRIAVSDVQSATVDIQTYVGDSMRIVPARMLDFLAISPYLHELAKKYDVAISDEDARKELSTKVRTPSQAGVEVIRTNGELVGLQQRLGDQQAKQVLSEVPQRLEADGFEVNPRFGTYDAATGDVVVVQPNWLKITKAAVPATVPVP
jgi:hypothetical protein